ncbi:MAG TPA: hypothetical protein V6D03_08480 [Candidatus Caenarcaniphilales bacterium]
MDNLTQFQVYQIVCLEHKDTSLYAEVIQVAAQRQTCWVRPLILVVCSDSTEQTLGLPLDPEIYDLRQQADLLWPARLFRAVLDTEALPLLARMQAWECPKANTGTATLAAHQQFKQFIQQAWQADRHEFLT